MKAKSNHRLIDNEPQAYKMFSIQLLNRNKINYLNFIKLLIIFIISVLFFTACKKENLPNVNCNEPTSEILKVKKIIIGKWAWAYERYLDRLSQAYIIKSPQSEGFSRRYEFLKNSDVKIFQNEVLIETANYEVTTLNVVTGFEADRERTILLLKRKSNGQRIDFAPIVICSDTLTINYQAYSDTKGQEKWNKN